MDFIAELLESVRYSFFQLKDNIIKWFQSLRGTNPEISNDEMPPIQDGPASRTRSTSTQPSEYPEENSPESNEGSEEEHSNQSGSDENILKGELEEEEN